MFGLDNLSYHSTKISQAGNSKNNDQHQKDPLLVQKKGTLNRKQSQSQTRLIGNADLKGACVSPYPNTSSSNSSGDPRWILLGQKSAKQPAQPEIIENRIASKSDLSKASYETPRGFQMIREMVLDTQSEHLSVAQRSLNSDYTMKSDYPQRETNQLQVPKQSQFRNEHLQQLNYQEGNDPQFRDRGESNFAKNSEKQDARSELDFETQKSQYNLRVGLRLKYFNFQDESNEDYHRKTQGYDLEEIVREQVFRLTELTEDDLDHVGKIFDKNATSEIKYRNTFHAKTSKNE